MKLNLRVDNVIASLEGYHRVCLEKVGARWFLIGVRNSGNRLAIFAVRRFTGDTDMEAQTRADSGLSEIHKSLDSGRGVCLVSREFVSIDDDPDAQRCLEEHNQALEAVDTGRDKPVGLPR